MLGADPHAMNGTNTGQRTSRIRGVQAVEEAVREKARRRAEGATLSSRIILALAVLTATLCLSVLGNIWQGQTGVRVEPYVVRIDRLGQETPLVRLADLPLTPEQTTIISALLLWIDWARTVSSDPVILGKNWEQLAAYTTNAGLNQLEKFREQQKARQQDGLRVEIGKVAVRPIPKSRSYTVTWDERAYDPDGRLIPGQSGKWSGNITVADFQGKAVKHERDLRLKRGDYRNIQGILVDEVDWKPTGVEVDMMPTREGG